MIKGSMWLGFCFFLTQTKEFPTKCSAVGLLCWTGHACHLTHIPTQEATEQKKKMKMHIATLSQKQSKLEVPDPKKEYTWQLVHLHTQEEAPTE